MRMFWAEYLTHYGVDGLFATWEKVTILHSPASAALAAVVGARARARVGVGPARICSC